MRSVLISFVSFAIGVCAASAAHASPGITGYSGKPYNGVNDTCKTTCHVGGGAAPTLDVTGVPMAMKAGESAEVTLVINGNRTRTSMNAALTDGVKATKGQNTDIPFPIETPGEIAAITPPPSGAKGTFKFSFTAPNKNGPITLYIAGMSANGTGNEGDGVATTTRTITISGAVAVPADAGASSSSSSSSSSSASSSGGNTGRDGGSSADGGDDGDDDDTSSGGRRLSNAGGANDGCNATGTTAPPSATGVIAMLLLVVLRRRTSVSA